MDNYQEQYKKMIVHREKININLTEKRRNAYNFFKSLNIPMNNISKNLTKPVSIYKVPLMKIHGSNMVNWPVKDESEIYIDNDFYDNPNNQKIINCQITHELLHTLSSYMNPMQFHMGHQIEINRNNNKPHSIYIGVNEATTQLFTEMIEGNQLSPTEDYLYPIKTIMKKVANAVGIEKLASQYINHTREFEDSFNKITNVDFGTFASVMNDVYNLSKKQKNHNILQSEQDILKKRIVDLNGFADRLVMKKEKSYEIEER